MNHPCITCGHVEKEPALYILKRKVKGGYTFAAELRYAGGRRVRLGTRSDSERALDLYDEWLKTGEVPGSKRGTKAGTKVQRAKPAVKPVPKPLPKPAAKVVGRPAAKEFATTENWKQTLARMSAI